MAKRRARKGCDCIFCNSKCPECGSINVTVTYRPCIEYVNGIEDQINLERGVDWIEMECEDCGEQFQTNEWSEESRLEKLRIALGEILGMAGVIRCDHKKGGKIDVRRYDVKTSEVGKGGDR